MSKIVPMLWFEHDAEAAANHYIKAFAGGRILDVMLSPEGAAAPVGTVLVVTFQMGGSTFHALNGGPLFKPTEANSYLITCEDQAEVDRLWAHFGEGGSEQACGWLKDRWGFSWQIVPRQFFEALARGDAAQKARVMAAMLQMIKFDVAKIEAAMH
jgi:predicted 3-demethylubiquinone-9 3-methyltransferase (glyoxalase superfamily)